MIKEEAALNEVSQWENAFRRIAIESRPNGSFKASQVTPVLWGSTEHVE